MLASAVALTLAASAVTANPLAARWLPGYDTSRVGPANAYCTRTQYFLDGISSNNTVFPTADSNANETVLTQYTQLFVSSLPSATNFTTAFTAPAKRVVTNTYSISGTICYPKQNKKAGAIQLLVHGIGFDSSYWDFAGGDVQGDSYSYVAAAAAAGYTTFRYDRLGTGNSDHPRDAYNVVQGPTDLAIATRFAAMLRNGQLDGTSYSKILGVGHSYGAVQMNALTAAVPNALDAVILQGFSANSSAVPLYESSAGYRTASLVFPQRFNAADLSNAYLASGTPSSNQLNFFYWPYYSNAAFARSRATEQPVTQGVLFTFGGLPGPAARYTGKVLVATGDKDYIFCLTNCYAVPAGSNRTSILDYVKDLYPSVSASNFQTYIPANTGHAVNQHYSAPQTYAAMVAWTNANL